MIIIPPDGLVQLLNNRLGTWSKSVRSLRQLTDSFVPNLYRKMIGHTNETFVIGTKNNIEIKCIQQRSISSSNTSSVENPTVPIEKYRSPKENIGNEWRDDEVSKCRGHFYLTGSTYASASLCPWQSLYMRAESSSGFRSAAGDLERCCWPWPFSQEASRIGQSEAGRPLGCFPLYLDPRLPHYAQYLILLYFYILHFPKINFNIVPMYWILSTRTHAHIDCAHWWAIP